LGSETRRRKKIQKKLIGKRSKVKLMKIKERNGGNWKIGNIKGEVKQMMLEKRREGKKVGK